MELEPEYESILRGESGQAMALAMETLVVYGKSFGAKRLLPIKSSHLAGTIGARPFQAYYKILELLVAEGVRVKVPTTINPRPGRDLNLINRIIFSKQKWLDRQLEYLGVIPNYSCVCYEHLNVPEFGDRLAWAESSAVQFANSVLGARTNRNSVLIDLCSAVTGLTPEFGYLLDEHRRGQVLVKLKVDRMDASAMGFVLGRKLVDKVPVIEHFDFNSLELKNMGGAMAAAGGIALFHVEGLTPEAPELKSVFDGEPNRVIKITQMDLDNLRTDNPNQADMVVFGCPLMTYDETWALADRFAGMHVKRPTWFCMTPVSKERFEQTDMYAKVRTAGVEIYSHCPLAALTVRLRRKKVLSSSGKLFYYLHGSEYGTVEDCLLACGVES
jgi:hypothetical protein